MRKHLRKWGRLFLFTITLISSSISYGDLTPPTYYYAGAEIGAAIPVVKLFRDDETDSVFRLSRAQMFGGRVGYSFYPGMEIELSATHHPNYDFDYDLFLEPDTADLFNIDRKLYGFAQAKIDSFLVNIIYAFSSPFWGVDPYVTAGIGIAKIDIGATEAKIESLSVFHMKRSRDSYATYQLGLGATKDITKNLSLDVSLRFQVFNRVKFKYTYLDSNTFTEVSATNVKSPVASQFTIGLKYKFFQR